MTRDVRGTSDRRLHERVAPTGPLEIRAWVRPGREVTLLDVSRGGAAVECSAGLPPGSTVELHMIGRCRTWDLSARIVRCHVCALVCDQCVRYRAALEFLPTRLDESEWHRLASAMSESEPADEHGYQVPAPGSLDPRIGHVLPDAEAPGNAPARNTSDSATSP